MSTCPTTDSLERYLGAPHTNVADNVRIEEHVKACSQCRAWVDRARAEDGLLDDLRRILPSADTLEVTADGTAAIAAPIDNSGAVRIAGYDILRELGRGGQGVVYQALQLTTKSKVAIKVLLGGSYSTNSARRRFEREIEMVAQLRHPDIVSIYDSGTTADGQLYYVMDYCRGKTLTDYIHDNTLNLEGTLELFMRICGAVQFAHQRGIIHRDLKPSNIRVDGKGNPKLLDFGLARWSATPGDTLSQAIVGTLPYMSPEQTKGDPDAIDTRSDIYALGVMLYEVLTGHYPYPVTRNMAETLRNIAEVPPARPSDLWTSESGITRRSDRRTRDGTCPIDDEIQTMVLKALSKEPERRYQSAGDLARDILLYMRGEAIEAKRDSKLYLLKVSIRQHKWRYVALAAIIVLSSAFGITEASRREQIREARVIREKEERIYDLVKEAADNEKIGKYDVAIAKLDEILSSIPDHRGANFDIAFALRRKYMRLDPYGELGSVSKALPHIVRAIELDETASARNIEGAFLMVLGRHQDAIASFERALEIDPTFFWAASQMAKSLAARHEFETGLRILDDSIQDALDAEGTDRAPFANDGIWLTQGTIQLHLGHPDALISLQEAVDIDGNDRRNLLMLARAKLAHQDYETALEIARFAHNANSKYPQDPRIWRMLALAYLRTDQLDRAAKAAGDAISNNGVKSYVYFIKAIARAKQGEYRAARENFDRGVAEWPSFDEGLLVNVEKEVLWIDTEDELTALRNEAEAAIDQHEEVMP